MASNVVYDFLLGALALVEFIGVGFVPAGESYVLRRTIGGLFIPVQVW